MYLNMTEQIAAGELPESLEDLTRLGAGLMKIGAKVRQTMAVIVAEARMNHFAGDLAGWTTWCTEEFALTTNTRSHLWAIGEMLLARKGKHTVCFLLWIRINCLLFPPSTGSSRPHR